MKEILNGRAVLSDEVQIGNRAYYSLCEKSTLETSLKVIVRNRLSLNTIGVFRVKHFNSTTY